MPYSLWVTRSRSYDEIQEDLRSKGLFRRLRARAERKDAARPLTRRDFDELTFIFPQAAARPDGTLWFRREDTDDPAFAASFQPNAHGRGGHFKLSASYTNPWFLKNLESMFDKAQRMARAQGARLFDDQSKAEVTARNVSAVINRQGTYVLGLGRFLTTMRKGMSRRIHAPLEFPLGDVDEVEDYFVFQLRARSTLPSVLQLLRRPPKGLQVFPYEDGAVLLDSGTEQPAVRLFPLASQVLQVSCCWSELPFRDVARATVQVVDELESRLPGCWVSFDGEALEPELREQILDHIGGLGVQFYEWWSSRRGRRVGARRA